jgi:hypothetical protein
MDLPHLDGLAMKEDPAHLTHAPGLTGEGIETVRCGQLQGRSLRLGGQAELGGAQPLHRCHREQGAIGAGQSGFDGLNPLALPDDVGLDSQWHQGHHTEDLHGEPGDLHWGQGGDSLHVPGDERGQGPSMLALLIPTSACQLRGLVDGGVVGGEVYPFR